MRLPLCAQTANSSCQHSFLTTVACGGADTILPTFQHRVKANCQLPESVDRNFHPHQHIPQLLKWQSSPQQVNGPQLYKYFRRPLLPAGASLTLPLKLAPQQPVQQAPPPPPEPASKDAGKSTLQHTQCQSLQHCYQQHCYHMACQHLPHSNMP